ncbi:ribonuclease G [uncultured Endozoicomonas sp.]|uniref:ribonuclease G n=1 Tax=uncultured Endozoicomonas sp. TaxID=432652 RepID=UPI002638BE65|nr:ribonuclease G [uncultured Endozoicomonas sp.]
MSEEILMNITPMESRVALVENGVLQEIYVERSRSRGIVGNIYKGKVVRVLPGMQAAFVDIGLERAAFIHASEISPRQEKHNDDVQERPIYELVHEGQSLVVQVTKDPLGTKGARLTTHISIPARYLVHMPKNNHVGISLRIEDVEERERLRELVESCLKTPEGETCAGGFILRTAAEGIGADEIGADILFLRRLWESVEENIKQSKAPANVYEDLPLHLRTMRDLVNPDIERIRVDSKETFEKVSKFVKKLVPEIDGRVEYYSGERPIFDLFGVEDEINKALSRKVQLKSGGYLILDQTEAMTTIDVNTGAFVGHRNLEETIYKTNLEAAVAIARQLRLRNLGGIIIIDFIDMEDTEHQRQVQRAFEKAMEQDHAKTNFTGVSELGLVEMTRKRTRESLENVLCESCPTCQGRGTLKSAETVCYEIFREILRAERAYDGEGYMVLASETVIDRLLEEESNNVADLGEFIKKPIRFQVESIYTQEQFDVVLV